MSGIGLVSEYTNDSDSEDSPTQNQNQSGDEGVNLTKEAEKAKQEYEARNRAGDTQVGFSYDDKSRNGKHRDRRNDRGKTDRSHDKRSDGGSHDKRDEEGSDRKRSEEHRRSDGDSKRSDRGDRRGYDRGDRRGEVRKDSGQRHRDHRDYDRSRNDHKRHDRGYRERERGSDRGRREKEREYEEYRRKKWGDSREWGRVAAEKLKDVKTDSTLPSNFDNTIAKQLAAQREKRKLLWGGPKKEGEGSSNKTVWGAGALKNDATGEQNAKFLKLMGVKDVTADNIKNYKAADESVMRSTAAVDSMESEYEKSRYMQHVSKGVGLGVLQFVKQTPPK